MHHLDFHNYSSKCACVCVCVCVCVVCGCACMRAYMHACIHVHACVRENCGTEVNCHHDCITVVLQVWNLKCVFYTLHAQPANISDFLPGQ